MYPRIRDEREDANFQRKDCSHGWCPEQKGPQRLALKPTRKKEQGAKRNGKNPEQRSHEAIEEEPGNCCNTGRLGVAKESGRDDEQRRKYRSGHAQAYPYNRHSSSPAASDFRSIRAL